MWTSWPHPLLMCHSEGMVSSLALSVLSWETGTTEGGASLTWGQAQQVRGRRAPPEAPASPHSCAAEYSISAAAIAIFSLGFIIVGTLCALLSFRKKRDYLLRPASMFYIFAGRMGLP